MKFTSRLIKYFNSNKDYLYLKPLPKPSQSKFHNKKDILSINCEDKGDSLGKTITHVIVNGIFEMLIKNTPWKRLFASEFLLILREK